MCCPQSFLRDLGLSTSRSTRSCSSQASYTRTDRSHSTPGPPREAAHILKKRASEAFAFSLAGALTKACSCVPSDPPDGARKTRQESSYGVSETRNRTPARDLVRSLWHGDAGFTMLHWLCQSTGGGSRRHTHPWSLTPPIRDGAAPTILCLARASIDPPAAPGTAPRPAARTASRRWPLVQQEQASIAG